MLAIQDLDGVFTGEGFPRKQGRHVTIDDCGYVEGPVTIVCDFDRGVIREIGRSHDIVSACQITEVFDATGMVATAGFIDSHTHALFAGHRGDEHFTRWSGASYQDIAAAGGGIHRTVRETTSASDELLERLLRLRLVEMLRSGCTTVEVKSGYSDGPQGELRLLRIIDRVRRGIRAPRVKSTFLGLHAIPEGLDESGYCSKVIDILAVIKEKGLAEFVDAFPENGFVSQGQARRFVEAAHEHGLAAKLHCDQLTNLHSARLFSSIDAVSVDHLERIDEDDIRQLAKSASVAVMLPAAAFFLQTGYPPARRLLDAGASVALASDFNPGSAPELGMRLTILLAASELRMSPAEILCALTFNASMALSTHDRRGSLSAGWGADILLWDGLPTHLSSEQAAEATLAAILLQRHVPCAVIVSGRIATSRVHCSTPSQCVLSKHGR